MHKSSLCINKSRHAFIIFRFSLFAGTTPGGNAGGFPGSTGTGLGTGGYGNRSRLRPKFKTTLGEISNALEAAFGRYKAQIKSFSGVYSKAIKDDDSFKKAKELANIFAEQDGRRPRIMIAKMGQDGHDRGAKVIATAYADLGFDVDIGPLFQTPHEAAKQAIENDVHVLGISSLAAGHKTLVPQVIEE